VQQQVRLRLHLRPAVRVEHRFAIGGEDVSHAVRVPEQLHFPGGDRTSSAAQRSEEEHDGGDEE
jgi:hypothetical protein